MSQKKSFGDRINDFVTSNNPWSDEGKLMGLIGQMIQTQQDHKEIHEEDVDAILAQTQKINRYRLAELTLSHDNMKHDMATVPLLMWLMECNGNIGLQKESSALKLFKGLLELGVNPNHKEEYRHRMSPLLKACQLEWVDSHVEVMALLLDAGANLNEQDVHGRGAFHMISGFKQEAENRIKTLCERGIRQDTVDRANNETGLHHIAYACPHSLHHLITAGANVHHVDKDQKTALFAALLSDHERATAGISALLAAGADINHRSQGGVTPLMHAAKFGNLEGIGLLLERGADFNLKCDQGHTALEHAINSEVDHLGEHLALVVDLLKSAALACSEKEEIEKIFKAVKQETVSLTKKDVNRSATAEAEVLEEENLSNKMPTQILEESLLDPADQSTDRQKRGRRIAVL